MPSSGMPPPHQMIRGNTPNMSRDNSNGVATRNTNEPIKYARNHRSYHDLVDFTCIYLAERLMCAHRRD